MSNVHYFDPKEERREKWKKKIDDRIKASKKRSGKRLSPYDRTKDRKSLDD